jgi:hypothetical protein
MPGNGDAAFGNDRDSAKQVQVLNLLPRLVLACPALSKGSFDFLSSLVIGQHRQRVAQIDHLVYAVAVKVIGHRAAIKMPRKQVPLNIYLRVVTIRIHPKLIAFMRVTKFFWDD